MEEETKKEKNLKEVILNISNEIRVPKEGKNNFKDFDYFKPDAIALALLPLYTKYRIIDHFDMHFSVPKNMYECSLTIEDVDSPASRTFWMDMPLTEVSGASQGQNAGATQTYSKRYLRMNIFNIADNKADPDADEGKGRATKPATQGKAPTKFPQNQKPKFANAFEEVRASLLKCKAEQLEIAWEKIETSVKYSPEQKSALREIIDQRLGK